MNVVLISHNLKDPEAWRAALGIEQVIHFTQPDHLIGFAEISVALDKLQFIDKKPIDWILYCNNEKGIAWADFLAKEPHLNRLDDSVYFTQTITNSRDNGPKNKIPDVLGNFYCTPHVFSIIGSLYKLNIDNTNVMRESRSGPVETKIVYGLTRAGYNIKLI